MEIDWGGKFNYTSCGHPMANWQGHEKHPTGHKTSEVDWGGHDPNGPDNPPPMSIINFDDLLGRIFLLPMDENWERKRATISEHVKDLCQQQVSREDQLRFQLKIDGDQLDDLISYNQLMEYLEDKTDTGPLEDGFYRFKCIKDHKGPYTFSEVDLGGHDPNPNHVNESLLSEVDWGAHNPDADDPEQLTGTFQRRVPKLRTINQAQIHRINDVFSGQRHPRFILRRSDAIQIYSRKKTDNHETTFVPLRVK